MKKEFADLLIVTHESVGLKMAGPGMRAWEMARALGDHGVQVVLATPLPSSREARNVDIEQFSWEERDQLARLVDRAEVVLMMGPVLARAVHLIGRPIERPTIVDLYFVPIEQIVSSLLADSHGFDPSPVYRDDLFVYLRHGDYFICALEKQYDLWLGALLAVGRLNAQTVGKDFDVKQLLGIVPFGIADEPPSPRQMMMKGIIPGIDHDDKIIFWGGGIWDWTDPFTLIEALRIVLQSRDDVRVVFGAAHHFDEAIVPKMSLASRFEDLCREEGLLGKYVFFGEWIPYDERGSYLCEADLGISLTHQSIENRYAVRARILDYLWATLPCVLTAGDDLATLLQEIGLGRTVPPGGAPAAAEAILDLLNDEHGPSRSELQASIDAESMRWSVVVKPILEFLREPTLAPDSEQARSLIRGSLPLRQEYQTLREQYDQALRELDAMHNRRAVRFANFLWRLMGKNGR